MQILVLSIIVFAMQTAARGVLHLAANTRYGPRIYYIRCKRFFTEKSVLLFILTPVTVFAQQGYTDSLDRFIGKQVTDFKIPGLAIGIVKDGEVLFKKGYGINSTTDRLPISTQTVFPILSCTKAFTAAAIGILVDQKKLHWNDKVIEHLPEFKLSDPQITRELTISDILSHQSGLETFEGDLLWYGTDYSRQEVVRRIRYSPLRYKFRSQFGYQNVMYLVAGLIIEKVSGQRWEDFVKNEILVPLSMQRTSTSTTAFITERDYAHPHIQNKPIPLINMDNIKRLSLRLSNGAGMQLKIIPRETIRMRGCMNSCRN